MFASTARRIVGWWLSWFGSGESRLWRAGRARPASRRLQWFRSAVLASSLAVVGAAVWSTGYADALVSQSAQPAAVPPTAGGAPAAPERPGPEVVSERTRFSRTYRNPDQDGRFITRVSEQPINFSTDDGETWRAIDNTVVAASGEFAARNAANAFDARLPRSLDEPVRVDADGRWVSFALSGAETDPPVLDGDTATYRVSSQVKASYTMHGSGVREALTLASAAAPSSFRYRVEASSDLTPRITSDGGVVFAESDDRVRFGFAAPTLVDADGVLGRAAFTLVRDGAGWTLTLAAERAWLEDPARAFPVVVDPDVYWVDGLLRFSKADQDCYLDSAGATTTTCSLAQLKIAKTATGTQKAILRFAVEDAIPADAQVLEGWLGLYVESRTGSSSAFGVELHRLTEPWTNAATWNTKDGSAAWSGTATDASIQGPTRTMGNGGFWTAWEPTELVQQWISRAVPNHGFVLQPAAGAPQTQFTLASSDGNPGYAPYIDVDWQPSAGQVGHYTYLGAASSATHDVQVNPANGNVMVKAADATLNGFSEGYSRTFNSQGTWTTWGFFGPGWTSGIGSGIYMGSPDWDGSVQVETPDGASMTFHQNANGTFRSSNAGYATLTANGGGTTYTLALKDAGTSWTNYTVYPDPAHWAARSAVRGGSTISVAQENSNAVRTISDGTKTLTQDRDSVGIVSLVDPGVGTTTFNYDGNGQLTGVTRPGPDTTYTFQGHRDRLLEIVDGSDTIALAYDSQNRVTSVRKANASATSWTTYAYDSPTAPCNPTSDARKTTVTGPDGVKVYCSNATLNVTSQHAAPAVQGGQLGLENYFSYESMPTGLNTATHVNAANGNMVWHSTPIVNPGRGLSSVVNLTYNSFDHGGYLGQLLGQGEVPNIGGGLDSLKGVGYGEAGIGFSLGISGITRLNEPLTGPNPATDAGGTAAQIKLTDVDGTRHTFTKVTGTQPYPGTWYTPPAGVELALRYQPATVTDPLKRWAATRPDGVTFYFDAEGYQTLIVDRNGNTIRFEYERYSKTTGLVSSCTGTPAASLLCSKRVARVVDPKGVELSPTGPVAPNTPAGDRALHINYDDAPVMPDGAGAYPTAALTGPVGGRAGRIEQIIDHGGRTLDFCYDDDGYLTEIEWWGGQENNSDVRGMRFIYSGTGPGRQMTSIRDAKGQWSNVTYDDALPGSFYDGSAGRRATSAITRRSHTTTYTYPAANTFKATAPGAAETTYVTLGDGTGRAETITNSIGAVTKLGWSTDNYLSSYEVAYGTAQAAKTQVTYSDLGNPMVITDPLLRQTTLKYERGIETGITNGGVDDGKQYVEDLITMRRPKQSAGGNPTVTLTRDTRGNVLSRYYLDKPPAQMAYDSYGQMLWEENEVDNRTTYSQFDANGLPQSVTDARQSAGEASYDGTSYFDYDNVGNLLAVTDPRGGASPTAGQPYTTSFTYDGFYQVVASKSPICTDASNVVCQTKLWADRTIAYDANGNATSSTDGNGNTTTREYTPMDLLGWEQTAAVAHAGEANPAGERTVLEYDGRDNLILQTTPKGEATATSGDFATSYTYDTLNRVLTQTQQSRGPNEDLITSYAYDLRDNLIGVTDPRKNRVAGGDPVANALATATRRFTYEYDKNDNRTASVEDPGGLALRTETTYDVNDNLETVRSPRGIGLPLSDKRFLTTYTYDIRDDVATVQSGTDRVTAYGRRADGAIESVIAPKGVATAPATNNADYVTTYGYNANGDLTTLTLPRSNPADAATTSTVSYVRNAVGDPTTITDPRGNLIANTFLDTGDVKTTSRPSWWTVGIGGQQEVRERTPDEWLLFDGSQDSLPSGPGDFGKVNGQALPGFLPVAGETSFFYSKEMELRCVGDVAGNRTVLNRDALSRMRELIQPLDESPTCSSDTALDPTILTNQKLTVQQYTYDRNGNQRTHEDGRHFVTTTSYDQFDRWITRVAPGAARTAPTTDPQAGTEGLATAAENNTTSATYDANGNQATFTDAENRVMTNTYDAVDRLVRFKNHANHVSDYAYDAEGNLTCSRTPRGATTPASACNPTSAFSTVSTYDEHSQLITSARKAVFGGGTQEIVTSFEYDLHGNQTQVLAPGADRKPGLTGDPAASVTLRVFDGRDRLWRERRGTPQGSEDTDSEDISRRVLEYDKFGNLRRVVNTKAIDSSTGFPLYPDDGGDAGTGDRARHATVFETNSNNQLTTRFLPFGYENARDQWRYRQRLSYDERGRTAWIDAPYDPAHDATAQEDKDDRSRTAYDFYENGWIKNAYDQQHTSGGHNSASTVRSFHYDYDRQGNQTDWKLGSGDRHVKRQYYPDGSLGRRVAYSGASDTTGRRYSYAFFGDGQNKELVDGNLGRTTKIEYDSAARLKSVNETWKTDRDTLYKYDEDGNVTKRFVDGVLSSSTSTGYSTAGKTTTFTYDSIGREREMLVERDGDSSRTTTKNYWPSGRVRTITRPNQTVESTYYDTQGRVRRRDRTPNGGNLRIHAYYYGNTGNRLRDDKGNYVFNARDQLIQWTRDRGNSNDPYQGSIVQYEVNGSGAVRKRTDPGNTTISTDNTTTTFFLRGDEIDTAQEVKNGVTSTKRYAYNGLTGDMTCSGASNLTGCVGGTKYSYDAFSRMTGADDTNYPSVDKPTYAYDALDRKDWKCSNPSGTSCTDAQKTEYGYIGLSENLSLAARADGAGEKQFYDYDSNLNRVGQGKDTTTAAATFRSYFSDPSGTVIGIEGADGSIPTGGNGSTYTGRAVYDFDPYGGSDVGEGSLSADAQSNPFRFQGHDYDSGVATYDMQARSYRPDIARFTAPDRFEDSLGDFALQSDPMTQNRYAFGAGNPVNNVEFDGHEPPNGSYTNSPTMDYGDEDTLSDYGKKRKQQQDEDLNNAAQTTSPDAGDNNYRPVESKINDRSNTEVAVRKTAKKANARMRPNPGGKADATCGLLHGWIESVGPDVHVCGDETSSAYKEGSQGGPPAGQRPTRPRRNLPSGIRNATDKVEEARQLAKLGRKIDPQANILSEMAEDAAEEVRRNGIQSPGRRRAIRDAPPEYRAALTEALKGGEIDALVKQRASRDARTAHLKQSRNGQFAPDFQDPRTGRWYDVTTPGEWHKHPRRYDKEFGGDRFPILWK